MSAARPEHVDYYSKFCLVKKDLTTLNERDTEEICEAVQRREALRSKDLDIDSHKIEDLTPRFLNLMWYCGVSDLSHRDVFILHSLL
jgi:hypothetical protein